MRWVTSFLLVLPLLVCSTLHPVGLKGVLAGSWAESGKDLSGNVTATTDVIEVSLPGLPEDARPLRMIRIPAGSFIMGSTNSERGRNENEGPIHQVTIGYDFYMGETEVTWGREPGLCGGNTPRKPFELHVVQFQFHHTDLRVQACGQQMAQCLRSL